MLNQSENKVTIEGILSEVDIREGSYTKNGIMKEYLSAHPKVRVNQEIGGEMVEMEVTIDMFAPRLTNAGKPNPGYESIRKLRDECTSIAAAGGIQGADRIRFNNCEIRENAFMGRDQKIVSMPILSGSFFTKVKPEEFKPEASFTATIAIGSIADDIDSEGTPTGKLNINGILIGYGGRADVVKFIVTNEAAVNHIRTYWNNGDTVKVKGLVNFSAKTIEIKEEMGFGDPIISQRTTSVHDLIITGGSSSGFDADMAFDETELAQALAQRKERLDALKTAQPKKAETPAKADFSGLGF